jgi:hypothetical protein
VVFIVDPVDPADPVPCFQVGDHLRSPTVGATPWQAITLCGGARVGEKLAPFQDGA